MTAAAQAAVDEGPGYETDTDSYYYEDEPRGGVIHIKPNKYGVNPRELTKRERQYERAFYNLRGRALTDGMKDGKSYTRKLEFGPGAQELTRIVACLGRGVKKLNGTQTLLGAQRWIAKYKPEQNWEAFEDDITGPNGKPDGLKEIVICDAKDNVRVVNGYTLCGSDYQWRKE